MKRLLAFFCFCSVCISISSCSFENTLDEDIVEGLAREFMEKNNFYSYFHIDNESDKRLLLADRLEIKCIRNEQGLSAPSGYEKYLILCEISADEEVRQSLKKAGKTENLDKSFYLPFVVYVNERTNEISYQDVIILCDKKFSSYYVNNLVGIFDLVKDEYRAQALLDEQY